MKPAKAGFILYNLGLLNDDFALGGTASISEHCPLVTKSSGVCFSNLFTDIKYSSFSSVISSLVQEGLDEEKILDDFSPLLFKSSQMNLRPCKAEWL